MDSARLTRLQQQAAQTRLRVLQMIKAAGSGHLAGSLGLAEVFTYFYREVLQLQPDNPGWADRDYFLLSAGHLCPALYATLAAQGFFFPDQLQTLRQFGSLLQGHPERHPQLGIENTSGPLGQGLSMAAGLAYGLRQHKNRVFVLSSDGEQNEGQAWESYLFAAHYNLTNFTVIIDVNGIQQSGPTTQILDTRELKDKLLAFNFAVGICDGNDFASLDQTWRQLASAPYPKALLCQTVPGKGVKFMENDYHWHSHQPTSEQWRAAIDEVEGQLNHD